MAREPVSDDQNGRALATWIAIGIGIGVVLGIASGNLATWIAIGAGIGVAIGASQIRK